MKKCILILVAVLMFGSMVIPCRADASDDTLKFYLSKSDLIVIGKIMTEPFGIISETGVPSYGCDFKVDDVLKGDPKLKGRVIKVAIMRFEMHEKDKHPLIKKDVECILFLKNTTPDFSSWVTSDFWFGIQYPSPWMAESLKRLAKTK